MCVETQCMSSIFDNHWCHPCDIVSYNKFFNFYIVSFLKLQYELNHFISFWPIATSLVDSCHNNLVQLLFVNIFLITNFPDFSYLWVANERGWGYYCRLTSINVGFVFIFFIQFDHKLVHNYWQIYYNFLKMVTNLYKSSQNINPSP